MKLRPPPPLCTAPPSPLSTPQPIRTVFTNGFLPVFLDVAFSLHHQYKKKPKTGLTKTNVYICYVLPLTLLICMDLI